MSRRGFSLVEVLISIVVLALGLLGVAAVFPAVLSQQRAATDAVMGDSVAESVSKILIESRAINAPSVLESDPTRRVDPTTGILPVVDQRGWKLLTANRLWSPTNQTLASSQFNYYDGDWADITTDIGAAVSGITLDKATGAMRIAGSDSATQFQIPLMQRLNPTPYSSNAQPQYVWDFAARRIAAGMRPDFVNLVTTQLNRAAFDDNIQLLVFVRRVDTGVRRPPSNTMADVLTGANLLDPTGKRLPVAADATGRPTFDGMGDTSPSYSQILGVEYEFAPALPPGNRHKEGTGSYLVVDPNSTGQAIAPYARQIGQKLVDSFGVVHTVIVFDDRDPADPAAAIKISPAVDPTKFAMWTNSASTAPQMRFTPQIPAAVSIINIRPADPALAN